jgi:D-alanine--poly(phosphoribitol) ligase subunit 1
MVRPVNCNLALGVHRASLQHPHDVALSVGTTQLTYEALARLAGDLAATLRSAGLKPGDRVGVLASGSLEAFAGVLGTLWAGAVYVPMNLKLPAERLRAILEMAEFSALIADEEGATLLTERVAAAAPALIVLPNAEIVRRFTAPAGRAVHSLDALPARDSLPPTSVRADDLAYIMFTSGTTGVPKGVMVSAGSAQHFLSVMHERYRLVREDRVAEPTTLSFDLSVFDMFMAWGAGASLHQVPAGQIMAPAKFIRDHRITVWLSVPSVIALMTRLKVLKPGSLPSLRYSLFCGEPLPVSAVQRWREAAPNSVIDNLYGPTEATVACLYERVTSAHASTPERGIVAIGDPFPGMEACIVDPELRVVPMAHPGELALSGPQLASGYFRAPDLTTSRFPIVNGTRWYLTGDLAYQDGAGKFHHLGRIDNQIKVRGYRVELEEIEGHLRRICGTDLVAAVAWPVSHGTADGIVGFVVGSKVSAVESREALRKHLPSYMVPTAIHPIESMPLNANGKVDRKALVATLDLLTLEHCQSSADDA